MINFILGVLFIEVAIPIIESLTSLVLSWLEVARGAASLKVTKINMELQSEPEAELTPIIGFSVPEETEEDYEE